ncbi:hypothetical protein niasHT_005241 [Heterodera trifolii]|uniref:Protein kinase domain-containing protein n=1 Tax=Heterodera trifolii TaxID=157864 RepID=A0ABD2LRZ5_9BILA
MSAGLLYERRHSEASPSIKPIRPSLFPDRSVAADRFFPFGTRSFCCWPSVCCHSLSSECFPPLPLLRSQSAAVKRQKSVVLKSVGTEEAEPIVHSGKSIWIGAGKYQFWDSAASLVGRGSYGIVFRGHQCFSSDRPVAIKRMRRMNVRPDELEAMKRVQNQNLVTLLDVCDDSGEELSYLVMELCDTDLDRHLRWCDGGRLGRSDMRVVLKSIVYGYHALYEQRVVHRDIKPQNILLLFGTQRRIRCAKITDFGVSRVLADETMGLCNVAGTLLYMAPEVGANLVTTSEYDHSADVWSIGCLLYRCLTGTAPFDESSLCRLFLRCAGGNYDAYEPPKLLAETDPYIRELINSLLQIDRSLRANPQGLYNSVSEAEAERKGRNTGGTESTE